MRVSHGVLENCERAKAEGEKRYPFVLSPSAFVKSLTHTVFSRSINTVQDKYFPLESVFPGVSHGFWPGL